VMVRLQLAQPVPRTLISMIHSFDVE